MSSATVVLAAEAFGVKPEEIAKTLSLRVGERAFLVVTKGTARLDNKKAKAAFGGKPRMLECRGSCRRHRPSGRRRVSIRFENPAANLLRHLS